MFDSSSLYYAQLHGNFPLDSNKQSHASATGPLREGFQNVNKCAPYLAPNRVRFVITLYVYHWGCRKNGI